MEYLDNKHKILKYLCKFKYGVTNAHRKCLVKSGEDYAKLETKELKTYKDAIVDKDKLRNLFSDKTIMTVKDFDVALSSLISKGYIDNNFVLTKTGKDKNKEVFKTYYSSEKFINEPDNKGINTTKLLFNE